MNNGLLPTPDCNNHKDGSKLRKDNNLEEGGRHGVLLHHLGGHGMLPTPQSRDQKNGSKPGDGRTQRKIAQGWSMNLNDLAASLLPTPRAAEHKGTGPKGSKSNNHRLERDYLDAVVTDAVGADGETCKLSHRFVMEMMGFPPNWVESAFTGAETGQSVSFDLFPTEMPTIGKDYLGGMDLGKNPATGKPLTASKLNNEGLRMGGNAIVPQVALEIFEALEQSWNSQN